MWSGKWRFLPWNLLLNVTKKRTLSQRSKKKSFSWLEFCSFPRKIVGNWYLLLTSAYAGYSRAKNGEVRIIWLTDELRALLTHQWETRPSGCPWVFHRNGRRIKCLKETWRRACQAAGLHGKVPHDLRRSAVRNLVRAGIPETVAMKVTGHADRSVFERYNIVSPGDLQQVAKVLSQRDRFANNDKNNDNRPSFQSVRTLSA